jgi:rSAM/selenodomain-associated transferase 1
MSEACCGMTVMAKASRPGRTKTRLVPPLTFDEAASLNTVFLKDAFANIAEAARQAPIRPFVAYGPIGEEAFFEGLGLERRDLIPAVFPYFGDSLHTAIVSMFEAGCTAACVLNSDTPDLPTEYLLRCARELEGGRDRVVVGPADDGGYYLLAVSRPHRRLFGDIEWSTPRVFGQTLERIAELGLESVVLPSWSDIDDDASLRKFAMSLETENAPGAARFAAPHSSGRLRAWLRETDLRRRLDLPAQMRVDAA